MSQRDIDAFTGKQSQSTPKMDKETKRKELAIAMGLKPKHARIPQRVEKLKRIHWKVIDLKDIKGTFWEHINQRFNDDEEMKLGPKFELSFQIRARKPRLPPHTSRRQLSTMGGLANILNGKKEKKDRITWIGGKRDQNIQIGLKTIGLSVEQI